jgi:hypothetical protein
MLYAKLDHYSITTPELGEVAIIDVEVMLPLVDTVGLVGLEELL